MLKTFTVENLYSFNQKTIFSMEATNIKEYIETNCFKLEGRKESILKVNSVHGLNNAGKSNLIQSLFYLKKFLYNGHMNKDLIDRIENFKFMISNEKKPIKMELEFFLENTLFRYVLHIKENKICHEALYKKEKKEINIFIREGEWVSLKFSEKYLKKESLKFIPENLKKSENSVLGILGMLESNDVFSKIKNYFENNFIIINAVHDHMGLNETSRYLEKNIDNKIKIVNFLKQFCFGINDIYFSAKEKQLTLQEIKESLKGMAESTKFPEEIVRDIEEKIKNESSEIQLEITQKEISITYTQDIYDENMQKIKETLVDFFKYSSAGTKNLYGILGGVFQVLDEGGVVIIDEIMGLLHTLVFEEIVNLFNSIKTNPKNAQIIFTGHNAHVISECNLRRDQIIIVKKDEFGNSYIERLSDYKNIKASSSFAKNYINLLREHKEDILKKKQENILK